MADSYDDKLASGVAKRIPSVLETLRASGLYPQPLPRTREQIIAERRMLAGLPGFEEVDYDKQAGEDQRLMLGLAGLKAAEAAFGGIGTQPIPGEAAVSTWLRGSVGPATGAVAPYAYDFMKRRRVREAQARADKQNLTQAALASVEAQRAAKIGRETTLVEQAAEIALKDEEFAQAARLQSQQEQAALELAQERGVQARKTADVTGE